MHYRINQMRQDTKTRLGIAHTVQELEDLVPEDMKCPACAADMIWRRSKEQKGAWNQITLQHWRDGTIGFLCLRCNVRHSSMAEDSYREMPPDHKFCPACQQIKHESEFGLKSSRQVLKRNSYCKPCNAIRSEQYRTNLENRAAVNQRQREYRAKRKAAGNPVRRKQPLR